MGFSYLIDLVAKSNLVRAIFFLALPFAAYLWIFLPLIPADGHAMGHDNAMAMPNLMAGYYWFLKNGPFAVPWFSPGECGGVPFIADLTVGYHAFPQWATFVLGPIAAIRLTFTVFALLGAIGFFVLMRGPFHASEWAALTSAVLFLFSGFYTYRAAVGQLLHAFTLTPWLAWVLLAARPRALSVAWHAVLCVVIGGLIIAYMVHSGMVHIIPPAAIAVAVILLVHGQIQGHRLQPWLIFVGSIVASIAFSGLRLSAAIAFLTHFPRNDLPLPGYPTLLDAAKSAFRLLFWWPPQDAGTQMTNLIRPQGFARHEFEYSTGPVSLILLVAGAAASLQQTWRNGGVALHRLARALPVAVAITATLAIPIFLNWYYPPWNATLKSWPYFQSNSTFIRWFALYVPLVVLFAGLAFDRLVARGTVAVIGLATITLATIVWALLSDLTYYKAQPYDGAAGEMSWRATKSAADVPVVTEMTISDFVKVPVTRLNDSIFNGQSQLWCYQPIFGNVRESMIVKAMREGPALADLGNGLLNVKNPACYLFPKENSCRPGEHFHIEQRDAAEHFLRYEPFPFQVSALQRIADSINCYSLLLAGLLLIFLAGKTGLSMRRIRAKGHRAG